MSDCLTVLIKLYLYFCRFDFLPRLSFTNLKQKVVNLGGELSLEERNLLSVAYKNVVGARRASWRIISSIEQKEESKLQADESSEELSQRLKLVSEYRAKIEAELEEVCLDILNSLEKNLLKSASTEEARVFFFKMKGDYYRYMAEFAKGEKHDQYAKAALEGYEEATKIAKKELSTPHPIRLGLALNFSVFYFEILHSHQEACALAKQAFDEAIPDLDNLSEESYRDSTLILQLLRDNLTLWSNSEENDVAGEPEGDGETKI